MARLVQVLTVVSCLLATGNGGSCVRYKNTIGNGELSFCAGIVSGEYYLESSTVTQEQLEKLAAQKLTEKSPTLFGLLPTTCLAYAKQAVCKSVFPACSQLDPYFLNPCQCNKSNGTCPGTNTQCSPQPRQVPGPSTAEWTKESCAGAGYSWTGSVCYIAVPKLPCKSSTCDPIVTLDKSIVEKNLGPNRIYVELAAAKCPLVSGKFFSTLSSLYLLAVSQNDVKIANDIKTELGQCFNTPTAQCQGASYTGNLLYMFQLVPSCMESKDFMRSLTNPNGTTMNVFPNGEQASLKDIIGPNIAHWKSINNDQCGTSSNPSSIACNDVESVYRCADSTKLDSTVENGYEVLEKGDICYDVIASGVNGDSDLESALSSELAIQQETSADVSKCTISEHFKALYYVPSMAGMPPIPARIDSLGRGSAPPTIESCPHDPLGRIHFGNLEGSNALCESTVLGTKGYNSKDCLNMIIQEKYASFPSWAPYRCRAAFKELMCAQGMMKMEMKNLCLVPEGCDYVSLKDALSNNKLAFTFRLPKFPSKDICETYNKECSVLFADEKFMGLKRNCDADLALPTCLNAELKGGVWNCTSSFSNFPAVPQYPESVQYFLKDFTSLLPALGEYADKVNIDLSGLLQSKATRPTITASLYEDSTQTIEESFQDAFCQCPSPLVVPDNVYSPTLNLSCCALPCRGTMYSESDMDRFGTIQLILSSIGLFCSVFMVLTWGLFEDKSKQYMTFWFSFCSFNCTLCTFIVAASTGGELTDALCVDNSTPHSMKNSGFSLCVWQSLWLLFFATAECAWWFVQAVDLFRKIVLGHSNTDASKRWYHFFAWGVPIATMIAILVKQRAGYKFATPFCFFAPDAPSLSEWLIFYLFVGITFVFGTLMMMSVLAVIAKHASAVAREGSSSGAKFRAKYKVYRTPVLFVSLFVIVWVVIFSFRTFVSFNETLYKQQGDGWVKCLLGNAALGAKDPANQAIITSMLVGAEPGQVGCGETQPGGIPDISVLLMFIVVMGQSIVVFLIFGLKVENFSLWCRAIGCEEPRDKVDLFENPDTFSKRSKTGSEYDSYTTPSSKNGLRVLSPASQASEPRTMNPPPGMNPAASFQMYSYQARSPTASTPYMSSEDDEGSYREAPNPFYQNFSSNARTYSSSTYKGGYRD